MTHVSINVSIHPYCLATYETSQPSLSHTILAVVHDTKTQWVKNSANSSYQDKWNAFKLHRNLKFI